MLQAAGELFAEVGYARTTMEAIAERAGLGVATVYKYFGSKGGVLEQLIRPSLDHAYAEAEKVIAAPPPDPGSAMVALFEKYRYFLNDWSDRKLLRHVEMAEEDMPTRVVHEADARAQKQIRDLLLVLKGRGDLDAELAIDDAAMVVFCVFNQHYEYFLTHEDVPIQRLFVDMGRRIRLLFVPWRRGPGQKK
ncbi:MAG TPA: TetR/AcrR family transcriptional regulator [Steroidobacter sp.]|uniref:TetR/AcrR family transcriptional regulator n=1 Tax=Steroidobacter sp. TaxID=1978227 RepID=UPI002ED9C87E